MHEEILIEKIHLLSPDKQTKVGDFVDFLSRADEDHRLARAAAKLAEEAFRRVWDNETDAAYDQL